MPGKTPLRPKRVLFILSVAIALIVIAVPIVAQIAPTATKNTRHTLAELCRLGGRLNEFEAHDYAAALKDYNQALFLDPGNTQAQSDRASLLQQIKERHD